MNGELAGMLENSWVGRRGSEDTGLSWSDTVNAADTLARPMVPQLLCISTCCEYSQKMSSVRPGFSPFTHCLHLGHWFMPLNDTWGKTFIFCSVDFSQNDSFLILSLPNTCFCNQRKDASIYCIFPTDFYSWRVFLSSSKSPCSSTLGGDS